MDSLESQGPSPALGRPGWVRAFSTGGAWIGAVGGAAVSVVTLPITFPLSLLGEDNLGTDREEFIWGPVSIGASIGHYVLGAPTDSIDFAVRRAWVGNPTDAEYEFTPMKAPAGPVPLPESAAAVQNAPNTASDETPNQEPEPNEAPDENKAPEGNQAPENKEGQ